MLTIFSRSPQIFSIEYGKYAVRSILQRRRGPSSVLASLERGLVQQNIPYALNPLFPRAMPVIHVISGIDALRWALAYKQKFPKTKLVAGPNIVVTPLDYNGIITHEFINTILVPSSWIKDMYEQTAPSCSDRVRVWFAGVRIPKHDEKDKEYAYDCLVYKKQVPDELFVTVMNFLERSGLRYKVIKYGSFRQQEYYDLLAKARSMIYLQTAESQGIALQEAWVRDVPTLVWNKGLFTYPEGITIRGQVAAPYMNDRCGMFFTDGEDFLGKSKLFFDNLGMFSARSYAAAKLSDAASTACYLSCIAI